MNGTSEYLITIPMGILSIIFTVLNAWITIYLMICFFKPQDDDQNVPSIPIIPILPYFKYTASITVIFNTLCSIFNMISCLYLIPDPQFDDTVLYIYHPSHIHRILSTICWYIAQVALIYLFSGRLYFCFIGSVLAINKHFFIFINIMNTIVVFLGIIGGYWGVFAGNKVVAEIGLNLMSRIVYETISFIILYMFNKRLLLLSINDNNAITMENGMELADTSNSMIEPVKKIPKITPKITPKPSLNRKPSLKDQHLSISLVDAVVNKDNNNNDNNNDTSKRIKIKVVRRPSIENKHFFLSVTTRNAILMSTVGFTVVMVTFCWFGFRYIFGQQTRLTLLIPMNMAAFDSLNTSICTLCLFHYGENLYYKLYGKCDIRCKRICYYIAQKTLT